MSAQLQSESPRLSPVRLADLDSLMGIEVRAYAHPWSRGNFVDSLVAGYDAQKLLDAHGEWLGYAVAMPGVEEMHLLNLTVAPEHQGRGFARLLLDALVARARERRALTLWLEVRESNHRAQTLYRRYGFALAGRRRAYYPDGPGRREDALVMSLPLHLPGDA